MNRVALFVILLMGSAATVRAQNPQAGAKWATDMCGRCHAINTGQFRSPNGQAQT
jgi:hypothetical protein